jgi:2-methylcitrate dehydratase PrpD
VEITSQGRVFITEVTAAKGTVANPMTDSELEEKFSQNASYSVLRTAQAKKIIDTCYELDKIDDMAELIELTAIKAG